MKKEDQDKFIDDSDESSLKGLILTLREWKRYLFPRWVFILIITVLGGLAGLALSFLKAPMYTAELNFALQGDQSGGGLSSAMGLASQFGVDLGGGGTGDEFSGDNLVQLMKLRSLIEGALLTPAPIKGKEMTLMELYVNFNKLRDDWADNPDMRDMHYLPNADRSKFSRKQDSVLGDVQEKLLKKNLFVDKIDKNLSIVNIRVVTKNELFSKYFAEALERKVSDYYIRTKTEKEKQNVLILQHQTDSVRRELNSAISGVAFTTQVNPNANAARTTLQVPTIRRQVDVQANTIILGELVKNLEITKMSLLEQTPLIHVIDTPILPLKIDRLTKILGLAIGLVLGCIFAIAYLLSKRRYQVLMAS